MASTLPSPSQISRADHLAQLLSAHTHADEGFWNFDPSPVRAGGHAYFQYPAMMVPELQGTLLDDLRVVDPEVTLIYDPFMGSGTVMLESLYRRLDFHGCDINPMAVLLSHVKYNPPSGEVASVVVDQLVADAYNNGPATVLEFANRDKWFTATVAVDLSSLRREIQAIPELELRRFLWVCLAETVRLVSNSRISTFKLHVYSAEVLAERSPVTLEVFRAVGRANSRRVAQHWSRVMANVTDGVTTPLSTATLLRGSVEDEWPAPRVADALMTSPPYGDNRTTVPYGQHSYLPLQWIDRADLVGTFDPTLLSTTAKIDSLSLGGSIQGADLVREELETLSPALGEFLLLLDGRDVLRKKVLAFMRDYQLALHAATSRLKTDGFSFWTLGERRVGQVKLPLVTITEELLCGEGHAHVATIERKLPLGRKRMAGRNRLGETMATEQILVMQKTNA